MKKVLLIVLTVAFAISSFAQLRKAKDVTITGKVIDLQCYISGATGSGRGPEHKDCAISCAKGGIPLGILEDKTNNVYLAGQSKAAMKGANEMLLPYVAEKVKVTGRLWERGGTRLIVISKISKLEE